MPYESVIKTAQPGRNTKVVMRYWLIYMQIGSDVQSDVRWMFETMKVTVE
jgi:hypothetical protein